MGENIQIVRPIGIIADPSMFPEFIAFPFMNSQSYKPIIFKDTREAFRHLKENSVVGLVFGMPSFQVKNLEALMKVRQKIGDVPIVVASEKINKIVRANMEFVGRVGHVDFNEGVQTIPEILTELFKKADIIERQHVRFPANNGTTANFCGEPVPVKILDISIGGAQIYFPAGGLQKNDVMSLPIPRRPGMAPVLVECRVAWVEEIEDGLGNDQKVGLQFTKLLEAANAA